MSALPARQARIGHEIFMRVERLFPFGGRNPFARAVRQNAKALFVVHEVRLHDLFEHVFVNSRVEQRNERLDPPVQIALHEVGGGQSIPAPSMGQPVAGAERVDARVFEKSADERLHANIVGEAGHTRPQTANAADHDVDLHAVAAGGIEGVDDLRVDERVAFDPDLRRLAEPGVVDLVGDIAQQTFS